MCVYICMCIYGIYLQIYIYIFIEQLLYNHSFPVISFNVDINFARWLFLLLGSRR